MGCYIAPRNSSTIEDIAAAIRDRPYGTDLLVAGNLNAKLADPEGTPRAEAIVYKLVEVGLVDMGLHFLPLPKSWLKDRFTWSMQQDGQEVRSQTDYILRTDRRFFQDVAVRDTRHHSDRYTVLKCLRREPVKELTGYLRTGRRSPSGPLRCDVTLAPDKLFSDLEYPYPPSPLCMSR